VTDAPVATTADADGTTTIHVDQFVARPPAVVWRAISEPDLLARWWAAGDVRPAVGHRFTLDMGPWGQVPCEVTEVDPERLLAYRFGDAWTLTWRLVAEGTGTRLFLDHAGIDPDDPMGRNALDRMGPGWRDEVLPGLAELAASLP
jgi:uncharacterized protein YndB with AHSA1/START domain